MIIELNCFSDGHKVEFRTISLSPRVVEETFIRLMKFITTFDPIQMVHLDNIKTTAEKGLQAEANVAIHKLMKERWKKEIEHSHWLAGVRKLVGAASSIMALVQLGNPVLHPSV